MKKTLAMVVAVLVLVGAGAVGYSWVRWQVNTPVASKSEPVTLAIRPGETQAQIASALEAKGVIRDQRVFTTYLRVTGKGSRIEAGQVTVNRDMSMPQLARALSEAHTPTLQVRLGEGLTIKPLAQEAAQQGAGTESAYESLADDRSTWAAQFPFLAGLPSTAPNNLEGFLFPNTYQILPQDGAKGLIQRQLQTFQQSVEPLVPGLSQATAARPAESLYSVLILASITEREETGEPGRSIVCGIFYNRLAQSMPLGSDASVLFALGRSSGSLSQSDLQVNSPYNTRVNPGLPPGPID
ncbi:MAG: endolytic transglycosylase MltG, partial [Candidatus Dormibacteraeota bacterium]|nr:endolytic transglycosylase MltG [Candidatus Dormibacteraeota bacterium]